ncbi:MAG: hypothetical protein JWO69_1433 [Thermoleophilia bacterium]|nr:hypothetical protein [Thermoleophilia bacterium]
MASERELEKTADRAISLEEIDGEMVTSLPNKEVMSLLDVNANVDLGLDLVAPVDLAVAANLNVAAPIEAAASANVLSPDAQALAVAQQSGSIDQGITGEANAVAQQDATVTQGAAPDAAPGDTAAQASGAPAPTGELGGTVDDVGGAVGDELGGTVGDVVDGTTGDVGGTVDGVTGGVGSFLEGGSLLSADIDINADANLAAPISGAVAANANIAAPINAAVAANIGSEGAIAQASAAQDVDITQHMDDVSADATTDQDADVSQ